MLMSLYSVVLCAVKFEPQHQKQAILGAVLVSPVVTIGLKIVGSMSIQLQNGTSKY